MKYDSPEYRQWKSRQNKKNLKRRTKQKNGKKRSKTKIVEYNHTVKKKYKYDKSTRSFNFKCPKVFSFLRNPIETTEFFNSILKFVTNTKNAKKSLFIDLSSISDLTIDALMYLLAIVNNLNKKFDNNTKFSGNIPYNPDVQKLFNESGFFNFVAHKSELEVTASNKIQIATGVKCNNMLVKRIIDFVCEKSSIKPRNISFLYNMIMELMSNTNKHAYNEEQMLEPCWYLFVNYEEKDEIVSFSFMDTGEGIPATVKKTIFEKLGKTLQSKKYNLEYRYVVSTLNGEMRTATNLKYRGKGLPKIREICSNNQIQNMRIITNKADVLVETNDYKAHDIKEALKGTLYYWQIDIKELKGVL